MLKIEDLKVTLDAEVGLVRAIDGMRLTLRRGQTFALVGESGCGKSMTALALMRLLPEGGRIDGGRLLLDEQDVFALPEAQMRAVRGGRIGMIFQEPSTSLNPVMRIGEQMVEAIEAHTPLRGAAAKAKAIEWLDRVGIPEPARRIDDYPFRMSGGQKQRVMIAMTLAAEPDYLIADEPTTALDVTVQAQILDLLRDLQRERALGVLLITHDLAVVSRMAHQVALMYAGQIIELAPADTFFAAPRHPYARLLLQALPDAAKRGEPLAAIAGTVPPLWTHFKGCRFAPRCDRAWAPCQQVLPALGPVGPAHEVRCLLYTHAEGASQVFSPSLPAVPRVAASGNGASTTAQPLLDVRNLRVRFPLQRSWRGNGPRYFNAVDDVSYVIRPGRTLALVGESGCGKTTSGKAIVQLLRRSAQIEGQALLDGQDLFTLNGTALVQARRAVQIVFQDPFASLNPRMRVSEVLEEGMLALRPELDASKRRANLELLIDQVGLRRDCLTRWPHEFSGGQRQRLAIARALAVEPRLIVCDEPTSALDVSVQAQILNLLRQLQRERGLAFLFITHNIGVVEYVADDVAVMQRGRIVEAGSCEAVLGAPQQAYTQTLLAAVPRLVAGIQSV
ncbi:ABC transporter ATP-binding protein [Roseateles koreensis]|uniref:Dipeptide ABC transporter ATP-binding protein n=1 Tax=Roseateles koreensis TaxID=2987526 RepID=A0ABT5KLS8_9BURK|nr:dipeptide ABC transporter ATP-binding protein [Roseateles koreensis]MDC8783866.1 dipeptide ABC transporter ATP-binding protein [Roseateles koreensis]